MNSNVCIAMRATPAAARVADSLKCVTYSTTALLGITRAVHRLAVYTSPPFATSLPATELYRAAARPSDKSRVFVSSLTGSYSS
jgi:hypothetical protein